MPLELLHELLKKRPTADAQTVNFRSLKHDNDLCPRFTENVSAMLEAYKAYNFDAMDIQGFHDDGVDVLLRYTVEEKTTTVGLQIKSFSELEHWSRGRDKHFLKNLRSQYATAANDLRVDHYFVVLCTDVTAHRNKVRSVSTTFKNYQNVTVITPRQALSFLDMSPFEVEMATIRGLFRQDRILREAERELDYGQNIDSMIMLYALCEAFAGTQQVTNEDFFQLGGEWQERGGRFEPNAIEVAIGNLEDIGILEFGEGGYRLAASQIPLALSALYFDLRFRRLLEVEEMFDVMLELLEIPFRKTEDD